MAPENWKDMDEFEEEFSPERLHPWQTLGAFIIIIGCIVAIIVWLTLLLDILRH
jgi:hypothetical protein